MEEAVTVKLDGALVRSENELVGEREVSEICKKK